MRDYVGFPFHLETFVFFVQRMVETCPNYHVDTFYQDDCVSPVVYGTGPSTRSKTKKKPKIRKYLVGKERNHMERYGWVSCRSCLITDMGYGDICCRRLQEQYESDRTDKESGGYSDWAGDAGL